MKQVLLEGGLVLIAGLAFALAANQLSPRGLKLSRDYFPRATNGVATVGPGANALAVARSTNGVPATSAVMDRLRAKGLQVLDHRQAVQLYRDPRYAQELILFVDARDDAHYQAGHVPGAYQFDHYHPEDYAPALLPACQTANQIVVYCTGGDCEDSEFTAVTLNQSGVPPSKVFVYPGGFTEWETNGLPVEIGARMSGNLRPKKQ